jgi:hypothetical protein
VKRGVPKQWTHEWYHKRRFANTLAFQEQELTRCQSNETSRSYRT